MSSPHRPWYADVEIHDEAWLKALHALYVRIPYGSRLVLRKSHDGATIMKMHEETVYTSSRFADRQSVP